MSRLPYREEEVGRALAFLPMALELEEERAALGRAAQQPARRGDVHQKRTRATSV